MCANILSPPMVIIALFCPRLPEYRRRCEQTTKARTLGLKQFRPAVQHETCRPSALFRVLPSKCVVCLGHIQYSKAFVAVCFKPLYYSVCIRILVGAFPGFAIVCFALPLFCDSTYDCQTSTNNCLDPAGV